jgi:NAD(P)-dependent dehydrogenase (short-subunit alcohol dehydrogenase family)
VQLDVCDPDSVARAFAKVQASGPVDVLVNNAGIGGASPLELTPEAEHRQMFETNYFGAVRCIQAVLPSMRERRTGCIVNISSAVGLRATPNQIAYSASKWALECLGEALAHELYRFGVRVVNIEPGVIMTNIFENSSEQTRYDKTSPYQSIMRRNGKMFAAGFKRAVPPERVADVILQAIETHDYQLRWPVGVDAEGFMAARDTVSAEAWVRMGDDLSDEDYNTRFAECFGVNL